MPEREPWPDTLNTPVHAHADTCPHGQGVMTHMPNTKLAHGIDDPTAESPAAGCLPMLYLQSLPSRTGSFRFPGAQVGKWSECPKCP